MYTNCEPQKLIQPHPEHLLLFQTTAAEFPSPWSSSFYFLPRFLPPFQCQLLERDLLIKGNQELEEMSLPGFVLQSRYQRVPHLHVGG